MLRAMVPKNVQKSLKGKQGGRPAPPYTAIQAVKKKSLRMSFVMTQGIILCYNVEENEFDVSIEKEAQGKLQGFSVLTCHLLGQVGT